MNSGEINFVLKGNHFHRYLNYAVSILETYNGTEPFHLYLKKYFSRNRKHGSGDRKQISSLCYHYFRIGRSVNQEAGIKERILIAHFLLSKEPFPFWKEYHPEWQQWIQLSLNEKIEKISAIFSVENIFPFNQELSSAIDPDAFNLSFLIQPKLFVRIRPGNALNVFKRLNLSEISFEKINENCVAFFENEKISDVLEIDKEVVIQDYNSQRTAEFFLPVQTSENLSLKIWDCCAASGGKSILAFDFFKNISLTVTDIRKSILENLKKRFAKAGIQKYHSFVADLSAFTSTEVIKGGKFDLIIADVPCSGSGTWSRTPEQLLFFPEKKIKEYAQLQKQIVTNAEKYLEEDGYLLYITCSVFQKENEENVHFIQRNLPLVLVKSGYLEGYEKHADTLFAALFKRKVI